MRPLLYAACGLLLVTPALSAQAPAPPVAAKNPTVLTMHGDVRTDDYFWLRERESQDVLDYLNAENAYFEASTAHTKAFEDALFEEIKARIQEEDQGVPYRLGDYLYSYRYAEGQQYPVYTRAPLGAPADEQVILDVNALAAGHSYYDADVDEASISPDGTVLVWAADTTGRRIRTLHFKNLVTGEVLPDVIPGTTGNVAWANDSRTLFYSVQDPTTLRSDRILQHTLGTDAARDALAFYEGDDTFSTYVTRTTSGDFLVIASAQTLTSEARILPADQPDGAWQIVEPRERDHRYGVDHVNGAFYIGTNREADGSKAENYRLVRAPEDAPGKANWEEVIGHRPDVLLGSFTLFDDFLVVSERENGLTRLRVRPWADPAAEHYVSFDDPAYVVAAGDNPNPDTGTLRFVYQSPTTPRTTYDYDMAARERTLLKRDPVLGGFSSDDYRAERLSVQARDGQQVPVTLVYRQDLFRGDGQNPLLLYGYGSYGYSIDPTFSSPRLSLLDRGMVFAIAHIRGSQTLGGGGTRTAS